MEEDTRIRTTKPFHSSAWFIGAVGGSLPSILILALGAWSSTARNAKRWFVSAFSTGVH